MPDLLDQLDERMANPPRIWAPKGVPDGVDADECITDGSVRGVVEELDTRDGDYGPYPVVVLVRRDKSRVQVAGFGTVLHNRLRSVAIGDAVGIAYQGTRPSSTPGMKDYDLYDVVVLRNGQPVSGKATAMEPAEPDDDLPLPDDE